MHTPSMTCAIVLLVSSGWASLGSAQQERPPRRAPFAVVDSASPSNAVLREYIHSVRFLTDHASGDLRMLEAAHPNQIVRIQPAAGNHLLNASQLRTAGRIVSRIVNRSTDSIPRFSIPPRGASYVWMQYVGGRWKGVLVSTDSLGSIVGRTPIRVMPETVDHPSRYAQSLARFITDSTTARVLVLCNPSCSPFGWCRGDSTGSATWEY